MQDLKTPRRIETPFTSQTSVTVTHNLGKYPIVQVVDTLGAVLIPVDIVTNPTTKNSTVVTFDPASSGFIIILSW